MSKASWLIAQGLAVFSTFGFGAQSYKCEMRVIEKGSTNKLLSSKEFDFAADFKDQIIKVFEFPKSKEIFVAVISRPEEGGQDSVVAVVSNYSTKVSSAAVFSNGSPHINAVHLPSEKISLNLNCRPR